LRARSSSVRRRRAASTATLIKFNERAHHLEVEHAVEGLMLIDPVRAKHSNSTAVCRALRRGCLIISAFSGRIRPLPS
jgi:hypothetical protein